MQRQKSASTEKNQKLSQIEKETNKGTKIKVHIENEPPLFSVSQALKISKLDKDLP